MVVQLHAPQPLPLTIVRAGTTVLRQGEPSVVLARVESGLLRSSTVTADGRELLLDLVGPREVVGEPHNDWSPVTVRALTPARLRTVPAERAATMLAVRARRMTTLAAELAWLEVGERIDARLRDLADRFGRPVPGGVAIPFHLTQDDLAAMVGASRETANRAIRELERRGSIAVVRRCRYVVRTPLHVV